MVQTWVHPKNGVVVNGVNEVVGGINGVVALTEDKIAVSTHLINKFTSMAAD